MSGAQVYFMDNAEYFGRGYIYGSGDFDAERFAFFSRAVIELRSASAARPTSSIATTGRWGSSRPT